MTSSGFNTVKLLENFPISPAEKVSWPLIRTNIFSRSPVSPDFLKRTCFKLRTISVTSSTIPFIVENSRSEERTSELQSLMRNSYAVFCLKKQKNNNTQYEINHNTSKSSKMK